MARLDSLSGTVDVLRIAAAVEQLVRVNVANGGSQPEGVAQLDELEQHSMAAESAAQRFHQAHEMLAEAVTQTLESGSDTFRPELIQARDAAFADLQRSLQRLEECGSRLKMDNLHALSTTHVGLIESALAILNRITGVDLTAVLENNGVVSEIDGDRRRLEVCGAMLRRIALRIAQRVHHSATSAQHFVKEVLARDGDKLLVTASSLQVSMWSIIALEGDGTGDSLADALQESIPWPSILRCTARHLTPLRATGERAGHLRSRIDALRSEVDAFALGMAGREQAVLHLVETYKAMKRARVSYMRLKVELDANSDDDSDAGGVDPEELARPREACRAATASRDSAARQLFLAAKAYHPETLLMQKKKLRLTGLSGIWSERMLDEYDERRPFVGVEASRHATLHGKYKGKPCILKLVPLQQGQALCKEVEILRRLDHPNIIKLEAAFLDGNPRCLCLHFPTPCTGI